MINNKFTGSVQVKRGKVRHAKQAEKAAAVSEEMKILRRNYMSRHAVNEGYRY